MANIRNRTYVVHVRMKGTFTDKWTAEKPTKDMILEALADEIFSGNIDDLFEIVVVDEKTGIVEDHYKAKKGKQKRG